MTMDDLINLQTMFFFQEGIKTDVYHSELHRQVTVFHAGTANVVKSFTY